MYFLLLLLNRFQKLYTMYIWFWQTLNDIKQFEYQNMFVRWMKWRKELPLQLNEKLKDQDWI